MRAKWWSIVLLGWALAAWAAAPPRAILLIWDSANDQSVETHLRLVQRLKELRTGGHFAKASGLDPKIKVYDCAQQSHLAVVKRLGRLRSDAPYLALVRLDKDGVPVSLEWGEPVRAVETALSDLNAQLGLAARPEPSPKQSPPITPVAPETPAVSARPPDAGNDAARAAFLSGQELYRKKDYRAALEQFTIAIRLAPTALLYCRRGDCRLRLGEQAGGLEDLNQALKLDPGLPEALILRGKTLYNAGQYRQALPDLEKVLALDPKDGLALALRGESKRMLGMEGALADLDRALELDPRQVVAWNGRGYLKLVAGQPEKAVADFDQALKLDPQNLFALTNRGSALIDLKAYTEALADLDRAIERSPKTARAHVHRARAKAGLKDLKGALDSSDEAIRLDPKDNLAWGNRGHYRYLLDDFEGAMSDCNQAIQLSPRRAQWYYNRAAIWDKMGKPENAKADREQAKSFDRK